MKAVMVIVGVLVSILVMPWAYSAVCSTQQDDVRKAEVKRFINLLDDHRLDDPKYRVSPRAEVATQLGRMKDTLAVVPLTYVLVHDDYPDVRTSAAYALGEIGDKRALPFLWFALNDQYIEVKIKAARSLIRLGEGKHPLVFLTLADIAKGINKEKWDLTGKRRWELMDKGISDPEEDERTRDGWRTDAMRGLAEIRTEEAREVIRSLVDDPRESVREWAKRLLKGW